MNFKKFVPFIIANALCATLVQSASAESPQLQTLGARSAANTAFIYHGSLQKDGKAPTALCDMRFVLFDAETGGNPISNPLNQQVQVRDGRFIVRLDFGRDAFFGFDDPWLAIAVRCPTGGGELTPLTPRQPISPVPLALGLHPGARIRSQQAEAALEIQQTVSLDATGNQPEIAPAPAFAMSTSQNISTNTSHCTLFECAAVAGKGTHIGVLGVHTITTGTEAGVKGETFSAASGAMGVLGEIDGSVAAPGTKAAGVKGLVHNGEHGIGVFGEHEASGKGVQGESVSGVGVYAKSAGSSKDNAALVADNTNNSTAGGNAIYAKSNSSGSATVIAENKGGGSIFVALGSDGRSTFAVRNDGTVSAPVIEITGGSDLAEHFEVNLPAEPGTLMIIDADHPGQLKMSHTAYDSKVAGIVSGAGGVKPGMTLRQDAVLDGDAIIAIAGRVYVKAEAFASPIKPGDLLTTSALRGHAMKATDRNRASGAVIGKAMTGLDKGTGLVLVLVNLQ